MLDPYKVLAEMELERTQRYHKLKSIPADMRNKPCPCGSLRKSKNCECMEFRGIKL